MNKILMILILVTSIESITVEFFENKLKELKEIDPSILIKKSEEHLNKKEKNFEKFDFSTFQDLLLKIYTNQDFEGLLRIVKLIDQKEKISLEDKFLYIFKFFIYLYYNENKFHRISKIHVYELIKNRTILKFLEKEIEKEGIPNYFVNENDLKGEEL